MARMKVLLAADHGGFELKSKLFLWLTEKGLTIEDMGAEKLDEGDDFVDYAKDAVSEMESFEDRAILICRNGVGVDIVANRYPDRRCALGFEVEQIKRARRDDDINCLALPADYIDEGKAKELVEAFLETEFSGEEKYERRLKKIELLSEELMGGGGCCGGGCGGC